MNFPEYSPLKKPSSFPSYLVYRINNVTRYLYFQGFSSRREIWTRIEQVSSRSRAENVPKVNHYRLKGDSSSDVACPEGVSTNFP